MLKIKEEIKINHGNLLLLHRKLFYVEIYRCDLICYLTSVLILFISMFTKAK